MTAPLEDLLATIRTKIEARGAVGIQGLGRLFRIADDDGSRQIDLKNEFPKLIHDIGINLGQSEIANLARLLDRDSSGTISYNEFLYQLAPPLNAFRLNLINGVFDKLDVNHNGTLDISDFRALHAGNPSPNKTSAEGLFANFLQTFDTGGDRSISRQEFIDYYRELNPSIPNDEYFETLIKAAWKLPSDK
jgi:Ca2+-binding EF-hand superfamily protein